MQNKKKLLVHICCAPCSSFVLADLEAKDFSVEGFFYNPNIFPYEEYVKRRNEFSNFSKLKNYEFKIQEKEVYETLHLDWLKTIAGLESEKERGKRCEVCFVKRLEESAIYAKQNNFYGFTTVLTISPHKNSKIINKIGKELAEKHNIFFLEADFKKNDGFKKSLELSTQFNFYRQNYCGCEFSIRS